MPSLIRNNLQAAGVGLALTLLSFIPARILGWIDPNAINYFEWAAVFTSYACTYLCVIQSRTNYLWGAVSVVLYAYVFYATGLLSSAILNIYLLPVLLWGWFRWRSDADTRPVDFVDMKWWPAYLAFTVAVWIVLTNLVSSLGAVLPVADSLILALSVLAQSLLDQKKIETWIVWFAVNCLAIYTYAMSGLYLVTVQYVFFLFNTLWAAYAWYMSMRKNEKAA